MNTCATYRTRGRQMCTANRLNHSNGLGDGWWDTDMGLAPVDLVISRVLALGYAHHIDDHREVFARSPRSRMVVSLLEAMDPEKRREHRRRAEALLGAGQGSTRLLRTAPANKGPHALS